MDPTQSCIRRALIVRSTKIRVVREGRAAAGEGEARRRKGNGGEGALDERMMASVKCECDP